ncbi:MAG: plasmid pRiA4b ORF-3 family protein, partial [Pseudaminobacter sp.]|nr:plasmid pRiA4b ORF-3 family protein [Pseudaminobacter sp.]
MPIDPLAGNSASILQLKVRLIDLSPMVWRRMLVPTTMILQDLHGVVQVAMGWRSLHLY